MDYKTEEMDWIWASLIAFGAIVLLHQPWWSVQKLIIGTGQAGIGEMAGLKLLSGLITSTITFGVLSAIFRRFSPSMVVGAVITQVLWLEVEWGFSFGFRDVGELLIRFAEEIGTVLAGVAAVTYIAIQRKAVGDGS